MNTSAELAWLVRRRGDVQSQLFVLHSALGRKRLERRKREILHLLLGAGFSLWRAVFLSELRRLTRLKDEHALEFLRMLIEDNAIAYAQDKRALSWTGGYYINNADMRLHVAYQLLQRDFRQSSRHVLHRGKVNRWIGDQLNGRAPNNLQNAWDTAYDAFAEILRTLSALRRADL